MTAPCGLPNSPTAVLTPMSIWRHYRLQFPGTRFGGTYTKIGTIQRRLAWPLRNDDTQHREALHIY